MTASRPAASCLLGLACLLALILAAVPARAQESGASVLGETQDRPQEALSRLKEELDKTEALVESSRTKEQAVLSALEESDRKLKALREKSLSKTQEVQKQRARMKDLEAEASALRDRLARQQAAMAKTLRRLYRHGSPSTAEVFLASSTLTEAAERATYARRLVQSDRARIDRYRATLKELAERQGQLDATASTLARDQAQARRQAEELRKQAEAKRALLASIQQERHRHEQARREMESAAQELEKLVATLGDEQRAATLHTAKTEREALPDDISFELLKGRLPWPIDGPTIQVTKRDAFLHKGLYLEARQGEAIEAVAAGTVVFADYFRGYGNICIIDHGRSYHTLYAHAEELNVKVGERVEAGQTVGRAGASGAASTPRLYFELRHRGRPIDPRPWMTARSQ